MEERYKIATGTPPTGVFPGLPVVPPLAGYPKESGITVPVEIPEFFLPGAAGHHRFADTRDAAVTLTPPPRPPVGDFFCLATTNRAAGTMIPMAFCLLSRESQFLSHMNKYLDWKVEAISWFFMFYIFLITAAFQPRTSMPYLGGAPKLRLGAKFQSQMNLGLPPPTPHNLPINPITLKHIWMPCICGA